MKQTLKLGDRVKAINPSLFHYNQLGTITGINLKTKQIGVTFNDNCEKTYFPQNLTLITPKKEVKKNTASDKDFALEWWAKMTGEERTLKLIELYKLSKQPSPSLLNDIETIEEIEEYCNRGEVSTTINMLIKNQRILTEVIKSLLIK